MGDRRLKEAVDRIIDNRIVWPDWKVKG